VNFGTFRGGLVLPFLWTGLEYFRSELYFLRFSWLNVGYAFSASEYRPFLKFLGMYGIGFFVVLVAVGTWLVRSKQVVLLPLSAATLILVLCWVMPNPYPAGRRVDVAGVQLEFPAEDEVIPALGKLIQAKPETKLIVLCEYAFLDPLPSVAARSELPGEFYDTAFVVGTNGEIVFKQGKCVPVQFLKDGLPAKEQKLWESPWGKIGICICYDLSYTRVTDRLVRLGARAMIVPTMDVVEWGRHEHELHARVARVRAAEYRIPIFRVASSGISQLVDRSGVELASAGFPGQNEMLSGLLVIGQPGSLPLDRWLGPLATAMAGIVLLVLIIQRVFFARSRSQRSPENRQRTAALALGLPDRWRARTLPRP
jgi:apolipoprotein N-acyltransferase